MNDQARSADAKGEVRKPYRTPCVLFREKLEALASTCDLAADGKSGGPTCRIPGS